MSEVWNNVTVYGPASEIKRFKRTCIAPEKNIYRNAQFGWDGCSCFISAVPANGAGGMPSSHGCYSEEVGNFQQFRSKGNIEYSFSFDTNSGFPEDLFEQIAVLFPRLAFDCTCIEAMDAFMGYGWFNAPAGGEAFSQEHDVPHDYWTGGGGCKRDPQAQAAHVKRVAKLKQTAVKVIK